ncbi:MAG: hypothetical protein KGD63_07490 [Candidatus Lokiarchaeota archaeon]|nr:hypothetical protein [Candidatus Lokiarchaeota archaeon]
MEPKSCCDCQNTIEGEHNTCLSCGKDLCDICADMCDICLGYLCDSCGSSHSDSH